MISDMKKIDGPDLFYCFAARRNARYLTRLYDRLLSPVQLTVSQFTLLGVVAHAPGILIAELAKNGHGAHNVASGAQAAPAPWLCEKRQRKRSQNHSIGCHGLRGNEAR
jgi:hypothetical protein